MLIKSDSASVLASEATKNNIYFVSNATNCGRHKVLLVSKWTHQYLFKRELILEASLERDTRKKKMGDFIA